MWLHRFITCDENRQFRQTCFICSQQVSVPKEFNTRRRHEAVQRGNIEERTELSCCDKVTTTKLVSRCIVFAFEMQPLSPTDMR